MFETNLEICISKYAIQILLQEYKVTLYLDKLKADKFAENFDRFVKRQRIIVLSNINIFNRHAIK